MSAESKRRNQPPFWMVWANPITKRYARSRLRPMGLGVWLLITLLVAGFFFAVTQVGGHQRGLDPIDMARMSIIPLLFLQGFIIFGLATGQVAGAMTAEADEGVLDYQRLAPMTPLSKVIGYLFGLPIREWCMFALILPFTLFSMWKGEVPLRVGVQLYAVILVAAVLYHLVGLLAGTVMKNRRWAFLSSMGLVFFLYIVIPQLAKFGMVYFKYGTIIPVVEECFPYITERRIGAAYETYQQFVPAAKFFGLQFPQVVFTLFSQGVLIAVMVMMLWRRWRRVESHLLGKFWALGLYGWIQLVLLGNSLPLLDSGELFPSREFNRSFGRFSDFDPQGWSPDPGEALVMIGLYGTVSVLALWWVILVIAPNAETQVRGWRRTRKLKQDRLAILSDAATATPWILIMVGMASVGWHVFAKEVLGSRWFPGYDLSSWAWLAMVLVMVTTGVGFQALTEGKGKRVAGLSALLIGVVPLMVGTVMALNDRLVTIATWIFGICPLTWPVYGAAVLVPNDDMPRELARAVPNVFWFWQGVGVLAVIWLLNELRKSRKAIALKTVESAEGTQELVE